MTARRLRPAGTVLCLAALLVLGAPAVAGDADARLTRLFAAGALDHAAALADSLAAAGAADTGLLVWRYRLATTPGAARRLALAALARDDLAPATRRFLLADRIAVALADRRPADALRWLERLHAAGETAGPDHGVAAGLAHLLAGRLEEARAALAAVTPEEPDFCRARWLLGELALRERDPALAHHYWDTQLRRGDGDCRPDLLASLSLLAAATDPGEAGRLADRLRDEYPGSLPLLLLPETAPVAVASAPAETTDGAAAAPDGAWALQLAAFRDRGRALALQGRWEALLGPLRVVPGTDAGGNPVYRVRSSPLPDRRAAERLARQWRRAADVQPAIVREEEPRRP